MAAFLLFGNGSFLSNDLVQSLVLSDELDSKCKLSYKSTHLMTNTKQAENHSNIVQLFCRNGFVAAAQSVCFTSCDRNTTSGVLAETAIRTCCSVKKINSINRIA